MKSLLKILFFLFPLSLFSQDNDSIPTLLELCKQESDLSNITKRESAGFLDLYTRDELEKMQANYLMDVLKTIPGLYFTRSKKNYTRYAKPSTANMPLPAIRFYINDHDMSSSSFGSAFMIWGNMPLEYIDHIEVYRGTSSIEFGNENASLVIKIYTKQPNRENGGKIKLLGDNYNSFGVNGYYAKVLENGFSFLTFLEKSNINRETYHNYYNGKEYDFDSDWDEFTFYTNLSYEDWIVEIGNYNKNSGNFIGMGIHQTPSGGDFESRHSYLHVTKSFKNNLKLQISADDIVYDRDFIDENGISINDPMYLKKQIVQDYFTEFHDNIFSVILEKTIDVQNHHLLFGGFYKYKSFQEDGKFFNDLTHYSVVDSYENVNHLYSAYIEDVYDYDLDTKIIASIKGDFYRFDTTVDSQDKYIFRIGGIKNISDFQIKLFYTDSYITVAPFQLYNNQIPYTTDPHLDYPKSKLYMASVRYKIDKHEIEFESAYNSVDGNIIMTSQGYINNPKKMDFTTYQLKYSYKYDLYNKLFIDLFYGENSTNRDMSPDFGVNIQIFNSYKQFDLYNELLYKSSYVADYGTPIDIEASLDWSVALKYHHTKDISFGIKGENLLDDSYQVLYKGLDKPIQTIDRKLWIDMEYIF